MGMSVGSGGCVAVDCAGFTLLEQADVIVAKISMRKLLVIRDGCFTGDPFGRAHLMSEVECVAGCISDLHVINNLNSSKRWETRQ